MFVEWKCLPYLSYSSNLTPLPHPKSCNAIHYSCSVAVAGFFYHQNGIAEALYICGEI